MWRKRALSDELYKAKKKHNQKFGNENGSVNSAEDIGDALILSVNNLVESWIFDFGASFHSSPSKELFQNFKLEILEKYILLTIKP